jgi:hypothetical protein
LDDIYGWDNLTRIDDSVDQFWYETNGGAEAVAKYVGHSHLFGYSEDDGASIIWLGPDRGTLLVFSTPRIQHLCGL